MNYQTKRIANSLLIPVLLLGVVGCLPLKLTGGGSDNNLNDWPGPDGEIRTRDQVYGSAVTKAKDDLKAKKEGKKCALGNSPSWTDGDPTPKEVACNTPQTVYMCEVECSVTYETDGDITTATEYDPGFHPQSANEACLAAEQGCIASALLKYEPPGAELTVLSYEFTSQEISGPSHFNLGDSCSVTIESNAPCD